MDGISLDRMGGDESESREVRSSLGCSGGEEFLMSSSVARLLSNKDFALLVTGFRDVFTDLADAAVALKGGSVDSPSSTSSSKA